VSKGQGSGLRRVEAVKGPGERLCKERCQVVKEKGRKKRNTKLRCGKEGGGKKNEKKRISERFK
jgi:hypothetical protein